MTPVDLPKYAFVTTGLGDGLELADLLAYIELDPRAWESHDVEQRLRDDPALRLAVDELSTMARTVWQREIPPLEHDLRAWLDFSRGLAERETVPEYLSSLGLSSGEIGALAQRWAARLADPALLAQAGAIMAEAPRPSAVAPLGRPTLPSRALDGTGFFTPLGDRAGLPFDGARAELRAAPPLSAPLPKPPDDLDATGAIGVALAFADLPFVARPAATPEPPAGPAVPPATPTPPSPTAPSAAAAQKVWPPASLPADSIDMTAVGGIPMVGTALPFEGSAAPPPPGGPEDQSGETGFYDAAALARAFAPDAALPEQGIDETAFLSLPIDLVALPFSGSAEPPPPSADITRADAGQTAFTTVVARGSALPFVSAPADAVAFVLDAGSPSLTLGQYAAVEVEIALDPSSAEATLARYGLDGDGRGRHAHALGALLSRNPAARAHWELAQASYRAWRIQR